MNTIFANLPDSLKNIAVFPDSERYQSVRSNCFRIGNPGLVIMAKTEAEIIETITFVLQLNASRKENILFSVRSGGHGMTMTSVNNGGLILDISQMNKVEIVDAEKGWVKIQAGAVWGDVAQVLSKHQLVISSGDFGDTGVGGLAISGGLGLMVRKLGITVDHILGVNMITGEGKQMWLDQEHHPELFWGIRGGGQLGIVTDFLIEAHKIEQSASGVDTPITSQQAEYQISDLHTFISNWRNWVAQSSTNLTSLLMISKEEATTMKINATNIWCGPESEYADSVFEGAHSLGTLKSEKKQEVSYAELVAAPHVPHAGQDEVYVKNGLMNKLTTEIVTEVEELVKNPNVMAVEIRAISGEMNKYASDFNAWSHRNAEWFIAVWSDKNSAAKINELLVPLLEKAEGVYGAYSSDLSQVENKKVWSEEAAKKLRQLAQVSDPTHLFTCKRNI